MKQVGLDLFSFPEVDGYRNLIACIDYFTKWLEAKTIRNKTALTVTTFLYELMCPHGYFEVQINDQGREFADSVCKCLHNLTGVEQRITSAYHPQSNGLVESQNKTMKNALVKVLNAHPEEWLHIIEGVLFTHCISQHSSTKILTIFFHLRKRPSFTDQSYIQFSREGSE